MHWTVVGAGRAGSVVASWLAQSESAPPRLLDRRQFEAWLGQLSGEPPGGLILAVPDDAIAGVARLIASRRPEWRRWCVLHLSGARDSSLLAPFRRRGAAAGSMHPMMTFPTSSRRGARSRRGNRPQPRDVVFTLEGDPGARRIARRLVRDWRGQGLTLNARAKSAYHLAATLVGPGAVAQMFAAETVLRHYTLRGAKLATARAGLANLLSATAANLKVMPTRAAWTGPFARGDKATQLLHLRLLPQRLRPLYRAIAGISVDK
jgi:predicted short-subunit dehydrogenase-like oxidoreductase (DUF2520 family)